MLADLPAPRSRRAARASAVVLALLVAFAAWLRLAGIDYLLPEVVNPDGLDVVHQVELFRGEPREALNFWYSSYPHLFARIAALAPFERHAPGESTSLERALALASAPWVAIRIVSVLLSLLAIPATYLVARFFLGRIGSLLAAGLIATSLLHVSNAIQEKPHAAATSFATLALLASLRLRREPDRTGYVLGGVAAALAIGMLHSGALCLPALGVAWLAREKGSARAAAPAWILLPIALVAASVALFYPFFLEPLELPHTAAGAITGSGAGAFLERVAARFGGAHNERLYVALFWSDPVLVALALSGIVAWIARAARDRGRLQSTLRGDLAVVLAFTLPYLAVLALFEETLVRFFLPVLPVLACAAGFGFERIAAVAFGRTSPRAAGAACSTLALVLLAVSASPTVHFARIRREPSPLDEAARWVEAHVAHDEIVAVVPQHELPLFLSPAAIVANTQRPVRTIWSAELARAERRGDGAAGWTILVEPGERPSSRVELQRDPLAYLRSHGVRYLVLDLVGGGEALLAGKAERVARFSPCSVDDGAKRGVALWGTGYDPLAPTAGMMRGLRTIGTTVVIYRVP